MEHKTIFLPEIPSVKKDSQIRKSAIEKPKKTRVLIENQVLIQESDYDPEYQWNIMFCLYSNLESDKPILPDIYRNDLYISETNNNKIPEHDSFLRTTIKRHMSMKLNSYKTQDQKNDIYNSECFTDINYVMELLRKSEMRCFYCKDRVQLLYKHVREPKQWTLERINNDIGHNKGNIEIACLKCNLRRRCMYHERFLFTKQMKIVKSDI